MNTKICLLFLVVLSFILACAGEVDMRAGGPKGVMLAAHKRPINSVGRDKKTAVNVEYYNGPTLIGPTVSVYLIYYGPGFTCAITTAVEQFYRDVNNSQWAGMLQQYYSISSGVKSTFSHITFGGSRAISSSVYGVNINDTTLQIMIKQSISAGYFPLNQQALYFIFSGTGVSVEGNPKEYTCSYYCGYHWVFPYSTANPVPVSYGIGSIDTACITGNACGGTSGAENVMTTVGSHELAEAISDTQEGYGNYGWADANSGGEIADVCGIPTNVSLQNKGYYYIVESLWSVNNAGCAVVNITSLTPSISLSPNNTAFSVSWTAPSGSSSTDWIGLYYVGGAPTAYLTYELTGGATSGTYTIAKTYTTKPALYEFRYYVNDGYSLSTTSQSINVVGTTTLTTPVTSVGSGFIIVNWAATGTLHTTDWIGVYPGSNLPGTVTSVWWIYTGGYATGQAVIPYTALTGAGTYYAYYLVNGGYTYSTWVLITAAC